MANMDLSVIEGKEGSEFNCGVSPLFAKLRFQVDTLRGVLFAIDRYTDFPCPIHVSIVHNFYSFSSGNCGVGDILWERQVKECRHLSHH